MMLDWSTFDYYKSILSEARHRFEQAKNSEAESVTDDMRTLEYWAAWVAHANAVAVADDAGRNIQSAKDATIVELTDLLALAKAAHGATARRRRRLMRIEKFDGDKAFLAVNAKYNEARTEIVELKARLELWDNAPREPVDATIARLSAELAMTHQPVPNHPRDKTIAWLRAELCAALDRCRYDMGHDRELGPLGCNLDGSGLNCHCRAAGNLMESDPLPPDPRDATIARLSAELERIKSQLWACEQANDVLAKTDGLAQLVIAEASVKDDTIAALRQALDRCLALDPDGARDVLARLGGDPSKHAAPDLRAALAEASEALEAFSVYADAAFTKESYLIDNIVLSHHRGRNDWVHIKVSDLIRARDVRELLAKLSEGA